MNIQRSPVDDNKFVYAEGRIPLGDDERSRKEREEGTTLEGELPGLRTPDIIYIPEDAELPGEPTPNVPYIPYEDDDTPSEVGQ